MDIITSRSNTLLTHMRRLASSGSYRREHGEFFCDSPKLLAEAIQWKADISAVVCTEEIDIPDVPEGVRMVQVPREVMASVSPMKTPQGVVFTCCIPHRTLPEKLPGNHYMVLDGVQDPGNVGTILRTADAFECDGLILLTGCADPYSPKTVRATMGAVFRRSVWQCSAQEMKNILSASNLPLYGAALREDTLDAREVDYSRAAIAIGSEGKGLTEEVLDMCDRTIRIPMSQRCESLNAAVAAAVLLWEAYR